MLPPSESLCTYALIALPMPGYYVLTRRHLQNRKYITYRKATRRRVVFEICLLTDIQTT